MSSAVSNIGSSVKDSPCRRPTMIAPSVATNEARAGRLSLRKIGQLKLWSDRLNRSNHCWD